MASFLGATLRKSYVLNHLLKLQPINARGVSFSTLTCFVNKNNNNKVISNNTNSTLITTSPSSSSLSQSGDSSPNNSTDDSNTTEADANYVQGARPPFPSSNANYNKYTRQYFYFLSHLGFLYLNDVKIKNFVTGFKDKVFLDFFFKRIRKNETGLYEDEFPYISLCGREINFLKVDDRPIIYHKLTPDDQLIYAGTLSAPFKPELVLLSLSTGRIYHPSHFDSPGLLCSSICVELGKSIVFESENSNTGTLTYKDKQYQIGLIP